MKNMLSTLLISATLATTAPVTTVPFTATMIVTTVAAITFADVDSANACEWTKNKPCGYNPDPGITYSGNNRPTNMVKATVCYSEWEDLAGPDRWWGPTISRGGWSADRPAIHSQCYTQWVVKGSRIESDSACTDGKVLKTPRITKAGTYTLM